MDASVGFAWVYPSQASAETEGLLAAQRRKLLTGSERRLALEMLSALRVTIDDESGHAAFHETSTLAAKYGLSVYDAAYLEVALRRRLPVGSRDGALRSAAKRSGVRILESSRG